MTLEISTSYHTNNAYNDITPSPPIVSEPDPSTTTTKTHEIGLSVIIAGTLVGIAVIGACAATGTGIAAIVAVIVPISTILALKVGAIVGAAVGLLLTPLALYLIKRFALKREIPDQELQKLEETFTEELKNPLLDKTLAPALGEYSQNDGFITADSAESIEFKLKLIEEAEQSIEIMPNYFNGEVMDRTLEALEKQLESKPKLKVHLLISSLPHDPPTREQWKKFYHIKEIYSDRFEFFFTPLTPAIEPMLSRYDNHMKMVIVDEKYFVFGGSSLIDQFSGKGDESPNLPSSLNPLDKLYSLRFRDHDLVGKGPLAKTLRLVFYKQYASWSYISDNKQKQLNNLYFQLTQEGKCAEIAQIDSDQRLVRGVNMRLFISTPHCSKEKACTLEHQRIISEAQELTICNLYFDLIPEINGALEQAIKNKASMKILTNGCEGKSPPIQSFFMSFSSRRHYRHLLQLSEKGEEEKGSELEIFEYDVPQTIFHCKAIAAKNLNGAEEGLIGGYNLSLRSDIFEDEAIISFQNKMLTDQLKNVLEIDLALARKVTVEKTPALFENLLSEVNHLAISYI